MGCQIFISYRREGGEIMAAFLNERLKQKGYDVFYDVETLNNGVFGDNIFEEIESSNDVLVVLPQGGLDRCINNSEDWVRKEVVHAIEHQKNIIPVMMRNFVFPQNLPDDMKKLADYNGVSVNMEYFDAVFTKLTNQLLISKVDYDSDEERFDELRQRAKEGDPVAKNKLAFAYEHGQYGKYSFSPNLSVAFQLYNEAYFKTSYMPAAYNLADIYERCAKDLTLIPEYGVDIGELREAGEIKDMLLEKAYDYYAQAASCNLVPAYYRMGNLLEQKGAFKEALKNYQKAADAEYPPALNALGYIYHNGFGGVKVDINEAIKNYQKAIDKEYPAAIYNYAMLIRTDQEKEDEAVKLLRKVAYGENAIPLATYALGHIYENKPKPDLRNAVICYEQAFARGVREAGVALERCRNTVLLLKDHDNAGDRKEESTGEKENRI